MGPGAAGKGLPHQSPGSPAVQVHEDQVGLPFWFWQGPPCGHNRGTLEQLPLTSCPSGSPGRGLEVRAPCPVSPWPGSLWASPCPRAPEKPQGCFPEGVCQTLCSYPCTKRACGPCGICLAGARQAAGLHAGPETQPHRVAELLGMVAGGMGAPGVGGPERPVPHPPCSPHRLGPHSW